MGCAFGVLGLSPNDFWGMTMLEFWAAYKGRFPEELTSEPIQPLSRSELNELMLRFPD